MKTNVLSLLAFAGALVLMSACASEEANKQEPEQKQEPGTEGLTAFVVDEGTRTTADYDGSGLNFYWTAGDDLWVNNNTALPAVVSKNSTNNIGTLLAPKPANDKKTPTAKFYFAGNFTAPSYTVRYTGKNSPSGSKVTIKAQQNQNVANDASHIGESGDCGTATATKSGGKYNFTLDHKAAYLTFTPYNSQNAISAVHIAQIKVTADKAICGQFDFNDNGIDVDNSRPATTPANQSITLTLNGAAANTGFPIPGGSSDASKNAAVMVLAPGTYNTFTVEYLLRDNATNINKTIVKTYNNLTLNAGRNRRVTTDLQVKDYSPWFNDIYQWDAKAPYWDGVTLPDVIQNNINYNSYGTPSANSHYNTANYNGTINASNSCKNLLNVNEMLYYVWYGNPHYDNSTLYAYKGHLYTGGLWLKKLSVIYNNLKAAGYNQLSSQAAMKQKFYSSPSDAGRDYRNPMGFNNIARVPTAGIPTPTSDYFYLPALGIFNTGTLYGAGSYGDYWTSSGYPSTSTAAFDLNFWSTRVELNLQLQRWRGILVRPFE